MKINKTHPVSLFVIPGIVLFTLISCGFGNKENKDSDLPGTEESGYTVEAEDDTVNEWKGWVAPEELNGYSLETFITDPYKNNDLYSAMAVYKKDDHVLRIQVIDGSTDKGKSEIRPHLKIAEQNINSESSFGYEKTVERKGVKAKEEYLASPGQYLIRFMLKDNYAVSVKSNATDAETIWKLVDMAKLEGLQ